jgi:formate hydrogenlyase transcriptional activator
VTTLGSSDPPHSRYGTTAAEEFLATAFEWLPIGVLMVNADGAIVLANREIERMFGYIREELLGNSVDMLVPDRWRPKHADLRQRFLQHPRPRSMGAGRELFGRRKDGSDVAVEIGLTPIPHGDSHFVVVSVIDITERRRIETELRAAQEERLRFETLVGELGAEFINLRADDVDRAIEDALGRVVRMLDLDRSALFQVVEASGDFVHTHQWTRPGWASPPPRVSAREQFPWLLAQLRAGEVVSFTTLDEVPDATDRESLRRIGTKSNVTVPIVIGGKTSAAVTFAAIRGARDWPPVVVNRLRVVALIFGNAIARKQADDALHRAMAEVADLRNRLRDENAYLRNELKVLTGAPAIVGNSPAIRRVLEQARQVAPTDTTVLLLGETGTGKTLFAARIHESSPRHERALVRVNCASLSAAWIENELFGSEQGSHVDGEPRRVGRLELAHTSTVFLDEIADLPLAAQAHLARVLQEKQFQPFGSARPIKVDVRIIAATRHDLTRRIDEAAFRDDLYYLLNVFPIQIPPLRDRPEDIPLLVWRFVDEFSDAYGKPIDTIDKATMAALQRYEWPGNARELRNVVERAMIVARGRHLRIALPERGSGATRRSETLASVEKEHITAILVACNWQIRGKHGAAARLGLKADALLGRMAKLGIRAPRDGR